MSKHMPGPWEFERPFRDTFSHSGGHSTQECSHLEAHLADAPNEYEDDDRIEVYGPNQKSNARLIAAAPLLLSALKRLLAADDALADEGNGEYMSSAIGAAHAAIRKAEGKDTPGAE